ncbi:MAG: hypothetical protein KDK54_19635 [Leptospiraceae bacterium]|nr:hypothetical protein [Leptospiraceae bacterium]
MILSKLIFIFRSQKYIQERTIIQDGKENTYYILNFGIPENAIYQTSKNILHNTKEEAIEHAYNIYKGTAKK